MAESILPDVEMYVTQRVRSWLAARPEEFCRGVSVGRREPDSSMKYPVRMVVIRDDGAMDAEPTTFDVSLGVSVLAGTKAIPDDALLLARLLRAFLTSREFLADPACPFASVEGTSGPVLVPEDASFARAYLTFDGVVQSFAVV